MRYNNKQNNKCMNKRITVFDCILRDGVSSTIGIFMAAGVLGALSRIWSKREVEHGNYGMVVKCREYKEYLFDEKGPFNFLIEHHVISQDLPDWRVIANVFLQLGQRYGTVEICLWKEALSS